MCAYGIVPWDTYSGGMTTDTQSIVYMHFKKTIDMHSPTETHSLLLTH